MFLNLSFFLLISLKLVNALEFIHTQDQQRIVKYAEARKEQDALPYTRIIDTHLTDHSKIDYHRTATDQDKEIIFKAVIGGAIIHKYHGFVRLTTISDARYKSHCDALEVVNQSSQILWKRVLRQDYVYDFEQIDADLKRISSAKGFDYQSLLTTHFIKWFYEALESYQHERNLFGGTAIVQWLQESVKNYGEGKCIDYDLGTQYSPSRNGIKHIHIYDGKEKVIGVLKPKQSINIRINEWEIYIAAKSIGLEDILNPILPIRIERGRVIIDFNHFTHTLEPWVGFSKKSLDSLLTEKSIVTIPKYQASLGPKISKVTKPILSLFNFESSIKGYPHTFPDFEKHVDFEHIVKLLVFLDIFRMDDMHGNNLLWGKNKKGAFSLKCIDYGYCFTRVSDKPNFSFFSFSKKTITEKIRASIQNKLSLERLEQVSKLYNFSSKIAYALIDPVRSSSEKPFVYLSHNTSPKTIKREYTFPTVWEVILHETQSFLRSFNNHQNVQNMIDFANRC